MGDPAGSWEPGGGFVWSFAKTMGFFDVLCLGHRPNPGFSLVLLLRLRQNHGFFKVLRLGLRQNLVFFRCFWTSKTRKGARRDKKNALGLGYLSISSLGQLVPAGFFFLN